MRSLLRDLPPLIWFSVWYGLSERAEHARDTTSRPWLAAYQPAPGAEPATMDAAELRRRIHAALFETACDDSMVSLVDAVLLAFGPAPGELEQARVELARWDRRWALSERVVKRLQTELDGARAERAALWTLLKRAVREHAAGLAVVNREWATAEDAMRQLIQRTRERDAARKAINGLAAQLVQRVTRLGKAAEEIAQLRAEVNRLRERDATEDIHKLEVERDELEAQLADSAAEVGQLREDLAHARNQLAGPLGGDMVTLHVGRDKTVTGTLLVYPNGDRYVAGWLVDIPGRTLVPAPNGGDTAGATKPVRYLSSRCGKCGHTFNWHTPGDICTVIRCTCKNYTDEISPLVPAPDGGGDRA